MTNVATMPVRDARPTETLPAPVMIEPMQKVSHPGMDAVEDHVEWPLLSRLPLRLTAAVPLPGFRVRDLLAIKAGQVVASTWSCSDDVPLRIGAVHMSWCEFEVVEKRMAVRLTRLA